MTRLYEDMAASQPSVKLGSGQFLLHIWFALSKADNHWTDEPSVTADVNVVGMDYMAGHTCKFNCTGKYINSSR